MFSIHVLKGIPEHLLEGHLEITDFFFFFSSFLDVFCHQFPMDLAEFYCLV